MTKAKKEPGLAFKSRLALEVITSEMYIKKERSMMIWISILAAAMVVGLTAITTFGCGGNNTTPSETVDKLFQLTQQKNCQGVADLVSDTSPKSADTYVNECEQVADRLVSYSIGQTIYVTGVSATVETEVTIKENGVEKTNFVPQFLVKRGGEWKLTTTEN